MALGTVARLLAAVWPPAALLGAVGPLELGKAIPAGVVGSDKMVCYEKTNFILTY